MDRACRILAVDNEPSVTNSLQVIFAGPRYEITCVEDSRDALTRVVANPDAYDVIIVDQKMPDLTGLELVEAIRQLGITTRIIVVSSHLSHDVREGYQRLDVSAMFPKPFNINELRAAVDQLAT